MSEHLTPLDATFLELEEADESAHMHIGAIMVFDPQPDGGVPSCESLCQHLASRLEQLPRYGQRLSEPHTGGLSWPEWEDDPAFDLGRHVARAALPAPGGDGELQEWASGFFSQRLDRRRPLWEMAIVEGLANGRWALATKTHHCMVDGVGSIDVGHLLLDAAPDAAPAASSSPSSALGGKAASSFDARRPPFPPEPGVRGPLASLAHAGAGLLPVDTLRHAAQMGAHGVLHPRDALRSARSALEVIVREELRAAPHTSLNRPIGTRRRFEVVRVPLVDLREIKSSLGGTINDVVLALAASGLRALLESRGEALPAKGLRAMVPMNVRVASERLALGNRISSLFVELPVAEADPVRRYRETVARSESLKSDGQAAGTSAVIELAGLAPPVLHSTIAQALYATRLFNVTVTNVPGPQQTLYAFGAPLREIYPLVPLAAEHAVGVAAVSYDGDVFFGVVADRDAVPDLEVLLSALGASADELLALGRTVA
ncbi:MAG TPA: wax ester/triacylglycerol synthase family O-acyltransferase [Solirubrobacteraceae bacterium]|nr:wax ester/triacylglycerol synthase family O-acyltransferase [Solirubrobacteraceae bacterium]